MRHSPISRIPQALNPLPDETIGSIASRCFLLYNNYLSSREFLEILFGTGGVVPHSGLPTRIGHFCASYFGDDSPQFIEHVIRSHTLYPYFSFASSTEQRNELLRRMSGFNGSKLQAGIPASRLGASTPLRYCPNCYKTDLHNFGFPYWHRSHQLPLVSACHFHGAALLEIPGPANHFHPHSLNLLPPPPQQFIEEAKNPDLISINFAKLSSDALNLSGDLVQPTTLNGLYRQALYHSGFATSSGRVTQDDLTESFLTFYRDFDNFDRRTYLRSTNAEGYSPWIARLTRKNRGRQHPVLHLLMIGFLFGDWSSFAKAKVIKRATSASSHLHRASNKSYIDNLRFLVENRSLSISKAAACVGISVSTAVSLAQQAGIPIRLRPKKLHHPIRNEIFDDLITCISISDISKKHVVSTASIYRLLRSKPELNIQRQRALFELKKEKFRHAYLNKLRSLHHHVSTNRRTIASSEYMWLYRNDRDWLSAYLSNSKFPISYNPPRIDWEARDIWLHAQLTRCVKNILSSADKPRRVTIRELGRRTGRLSWLEKCLCFLPRSKKFLSTVVEDSDTFRNRRIVWAINYICAHGERLTPSRVSRHAGIRSNLPVISDFISSFTLSHQNINKK